MKYLRLILLAVCLTATPAVFTGCKTATTQEQIVFYTFKDIQIVAHRAYDVFAEKVVRNDVSAENKAKVEAAYAKFQDAFRAAFKAAQSDMTKLTPVEVQKLADELMRLIYSL